jgi:branched-chain amino acid transport system substrate-binding protein
MLSTSTTRIAAFTVAVIAFAAMSGGALGQKKYDTGATDTEIKIGNITSCRIAALPPPTA